LNLGWYDEAEHEFLDVLADDPDDAFAHAALGLCYAVQGRADPARHHQRRALELEGDNPEIRRIAAEIDRLLGPDGGLSHESIGSLLFMMLAAVMGRSKKGAGC